MNTIDLLENKSMNYILPNIIVYEDLHLMISFSLYENRTAIENHTPIKFRIIYI